ncbi:putative quinol monooxygenase [Paraburkholderia sp.]|uniref:putative quinol monooxygenase n=1 Tax=Paraburkholderia sp. TaxID=1926495 RepID=UPI0039E3ED1F
MDPILAGGLVVAVTFRVNPVKRDDFRRAVLNNARESLSLEQLCHVFDVNEHADEPLFFLYEVYESAAAFDTHLTSSHFLKFNEATTPWVTEKHVSRYVHLGERGSPVPDFPDHN